MSARRAWSRLAAIMCWVAMVALLAATSPRAGADDDVDVESLYTDIGLIGLAISNIGYMGNNFSTRTPSMEYPLGAEVEHLIRGGLWVGGDSSRHRRHPGHHRHRGRARGHQLRR